MTSDKLNLQVSTKRGSAFMIAFNDLINGNGEENQSDNSGEQKVYLIWTFYAIYFIGTIPNSNFFCVGMNMFLMKRGGGSQVM